MFHGTIKEKYQTAVFEFQNRSFTTVVATSKQMKYTVFGMNFLAQLRIQLYHSEDSGRCDQLGRPSMLACEPHGCFSKIQD